MAAWWASLSSLNQAFYVLAVFFSALFGWQLLSSFSALGDAGGDGADAGAGLDDVDTSAVTDSDGASDDIDSDEFDHDSESIATFRLLSLRKV